MTVKKNTWLCNTSGKLWEEINRAGHPRTTVDQTSSAMDGEISSCVWNHANHSFLSLSFLPSVSPTPKVQFPELAACLCIYFKCCQVSPKHLVSIDHSHWLTYVSTLSRWPTTPGVQNKKQTQNIGELLYKGFIRFRLVDRPVTVEFTLSAEFSMCC